MPNDNATTPDSDDINSGAAGEAQDTYASAARNTDPFPLAHPWLIYSELMNSAEPRAHEAAEELKREYLS